MYFTSAGVGKGGWEVASNWRVPGFIPTMSAFFRFEFCLHNFFNPYLNLSFEEIAII